MSKVTDLNDLIDNILQDEESNLSATSIEYYNNLREEINKGITPLEFRNKQKYPEIFIPTPTLQELDNKVDDLKFTQYAFMILVSILLLGFLSK